MRYVSISETDTYRIIVYINLFVSALWYPYLFFTM